MSIASYIKEIGRGARGARSLSRESALDLMARLLAGQLSELEIGAFCVAMRIKGESLDELEGFMAATLGHGLDLAPLLRAPELGGKGSCPGIVLLPSYNGSRRLPNLTPLLAGLLTQAGAHVLVHGMPDDDSRIGSVQIWPLLGWPQVDSGATLTKAWQARLPAYMPLEALCAPLAGLLDVRWALGLRNPGHTMAKLLQPFVDVNGASPAGQGAAPPLPVLQVVSYTHREYGEALAQYLQRAGANAMLLRGTEGEPVADARRTPKMELLLHGQTRDDLSVAQQEGSLQSLPEWPQDISASASAEWIALALAQPAMVPPAIGAQVQAILGGLRALSHGPLRA